MYQILMYNFEYPKKDNEKNISCLFHYLSILTNGNDEISNGQIDLNIAGGTNSTLPFACTTTFVFIVPSKLSSALEDKILSFSFSASINVTCCKEEYLVSIHGYLAGEWFEYYRNPPVSIVNCNHSKSRCKYLTKKEDFKEYRIPKQANH